LQHVIDTLTRITDHEIQVEVNPSFVRANEVHRLCGNAAKLQALLTHNGFTLDNPPLEHTLRCMLAAAALKPLY
jgi:GDP-D-mannose dehydratase